MQDTTWIQPNTPDKFNYTTSGILPLKSISISTLLSTCPHYAQAVTIVTICCHDLIYIFKFNIKKVLKKKIDINVF